MPKKPQPQPVQIPVTATIWEQILYPVLQDASVNIYDWLWAQGAVYVVSRTAPFPQDHRAYLKFRDPRRATLFLLKYA